MGIFCKMLIINNRIILTTIQKSWRLGMLKQYFFSIPITRKLRLNMVHQNTFVTIVYKWKKIRKIKHTL